MIPRELEAEAKELEAQGYRPKLVQDGSRVYITFSEFPLGDAFTPTTTDLMLFTSTTYPEAGFDMFWVRPAVLLTNGSVPNAATEIETHMGEPWRRFSWHLNRPWNPSKDSLLTWICYVENRLHRGV